MCEDVVVRFGKLILHNRYLGYLIRITRLDQEYETNIVTCYVRSRSSSARQLRKAGSRIHSALEHL